MTEHKSPPPPAWPTRAAAPESYKGEGDAYFRESNDRRATALLLVAVALVALIALALRALPT